MTIPCPSAASGKSSPASARATGELAASLRAIAPMTRHQAVRRWLDNVTGKIGGAHLEIWLAWRQLAPRDQRDRPRPETAQPAAALAAADFPQQPGGVPLAAGSSPPPPAKTAGQRDARRSPGHGKPDNREEPISANPRSPAHTGDQLHTKFH